MNKEYSNIVRGGLATAACLGIAVFGGREFDRGTSSLPSLDEALATQGLTTDQYDAIQSLPAMAHDARISLEYKAPNTYCNVKIFDIPTGGCDPEKLPEAERTLEILDEMEVNVSMSLHPEMNEDLNRVEDSIKNKKSSLKENLSQVVDNSTYSAERLALSEIEDDFEEHSDNASDKWDKAYDQSTPNASLRSLVGFMGFMLGFVGTLGAGGYTAYEINQMIKKRKTNQ